MTYSISPRNYKTWKEWFYWNKDLVAIGSILWLVFSAAGYYFSGMLTSPLFVLGIAVLLAIELKLLMMFWKGGERVIGTNLFYFLIYGGIAAGFAYWASNTPLSNLGYPWLLSKVILFAPISLWAGVSLFKNGRHGRPIGAKAQ